MKMIPGLTALLLVLTAAAGNATAGTVLEATIGHQFDPTAAWMAPDTQWSRRYCEPRDRTEIREAPVGYRVKYGCRGRIYQTRTDNHPGDRIRVDRKTRLVHF